MAALGLPVLIGLAGLAIGVLRFVLWWWKGKAAEATMQWLVVFKARQADALRLLRARYDEIDKRPPKTGDDLAKDINDAWNKKD